MASTGSVQKTGGSSWKLTISAGFDGGGKRIRHTKTVRITGSTIDAQEKEARRQLALFIAEVDKGQIAKSGKMKVKDFAETWLKEYCQKSLAPKTQRSYKLHMEKRIVPALGNIYINKLRPLQIMEFINNLQEPGLRLDGKSTTLSGETAMYCYRVLASMLHDAVELQIIPSNPCDRVKPPIVKKRKAANNALNEAQTAIMLTALEAEPLKYRTIVLLTLVTGLRLGELCGLEWADIDLQEETLTVNRSSQSLSGLGTFSKTPKNETSTRCITLPKTITNLLKEYKAWQNEERLRIGEKWHQSDRLFTTWDGKPVYVQTPSQWFHKFLVQYNKSVEEDEKLTPQLKKEKKLPVIRFHDLRHTSGSLLIAKGVPLKNISSRLGHADIRTTANIYGHALQSVDKQIANTMDEIIAGKKAIKQTK